MKTSTAIASATVNLATRALSTSRATTRSSSALSTELRFNPGDEIAGFRILRLLGEGAFARVYLAQELAFNRQVALKVSPNEGREALTLAHLEHDGIVKVYSEMTLLQPPCRLVCMQFISGSSLDAKAPRGFTEIARIGAAVAGALDYAHSRGVIHLDVKPHNILMDELGRPHLADFNVSFDRRTTLAERIQTFGGTFEYMAPEQRAVFETGGSGESGDDLAELEKAITAIRETADIYSLGAVLMELFAASLPTVVSARLPWTVSEEAVGFSRELWTVLKRATAPDPAKRFSRAGDLAAALEGCAELQRIAEELPPLPFPLRLALRRPLRSLLHFSAALQGVALTAGLAYAGSRWLAAVAVVFFMALFATVSRRALEPFRRYFADPLAHAGELAELRRSVLELPWRGALVSTAAWLALISLFALLLPGAPSSALTALALAGALGTSASALVQEIIVLRVLYPRLFIGTGDLRSVTARELAAGRRRPLFFATLTSLAPLMAAVLLLGAGPARLDMAADQVFRAILVGLLAATGLTVFLAFWLGNLAERTHQALRALPSP
jgi:tRNA A-37 threonylcarbamoyl transferase component Bud32